MTRVWNFSAGPAVLPEEVLRQAADEMLDWQDKGMSVMEISHRSQAFMSVAEEAEADLRELMAVPDNYRVLFMQGGAIGQNAIVPLNLMGHKPRADYVVTGAWGLKSEKEARRYGDVHLAATSAAGGYVDIPALESWQLSADPAYLFVCNNETIAGVEYGFDPDLSMIGRAEVPVVGDVSSNILSKVMDVSRYGLLFAGAQKNIGPAGVTIVIVRDDLLDQAMPHCPSAFEYKTVAAHGSMYNTPPTYGIYIAGLVFKWLKRQGGVAAIERQNKAKAQMLYSLLDACPFYQTRVAPHCRSNMNVTFFLKDEGLNEAFIRSAEQAGLAQLKGHKSAGGMRASIYNAMSLEGVQALADYMRDFAVRYG